MAIQISDNDTTYIKAECVMCKKMGIIGIRLVHITVNRRMPVCDTCLRELHDEVCRLMDERKI